MSMFAHLAPLLLVLGSFCTHNRPRLSHITHSANSAHWLKESKLSDKNFGHKSGIACHVFKVGNLVAQQHRVLYLRLSFCRRLRSMAKAAKPTTCGVDSVCRGMRWVYRHRISCILYTIKWLCVRAHQRFPYRDNSPRSLVIDA